MQLNLQTSRRKAKWSNWMQSFINYIHTIPGRDVIPLNPDFLDNCIVMSPIIGETFTINPSEVYTLLIKLFAGNKSAETKVQHYIATVNVLLAFKALIEHYKGVDLHSIDVIKAGQVIDSLFYVGEKSHMLFQ